MTAQLNTEVLSLTSLRFVAALVVFLFHCQIHLGKAFSGPLSTIIGHGAAGMTLFFVLSGYILAHVYRDITSRNIRQYYTNRVARIYPAYLAYGLLTLPVLFADLDHLGNVFLSQSLGDLVVVLQTAMGVVAYLAMIQAWFPNTFGLWNFAGSWSLSVEAFFYTLFPLLRHIFNRLSVRALVRIMVAGYVWASLPIFFVWLFSVPADGKMMFQYVYISPIFRLGEFIVGVVVYMLAMERGRKLLLDGRVAAALLLVTLLVLAAGPNLRGQTFYSFIVIPLCAWSIGWLGTKRVTLFEGRLLVYLGRASYSFYLAQFVSFSYLKEWLRGLETTVVAKWCIALMITLVVAVTIYHFVEVPFRRLIREKSES